MPNQIGFCVLANSFLNSLICILLSFIIAISRSFLSVKKLCSFRSLIERRCSLILLSRFSRLSIWQTLARLTSKRTATWVRLTTEGSLRTSAYFKASTSGLGFFKTGVLSFISFLVSLLPPSRFTGGIPDLSSR